MSRPTPPESPPPPARDTAAEARRAFVPPRVEDLGGLADITHQDSFGGPIGILGPG